MANKSFKVDKSLAYRALSSYPDSPVESETFLHVTDGVMCYQGGVWRSLSPIVVPISRGGTGATDKTSAFDALSPMSTGGDLIYGGASGTALRLPNGSFGQVLTSSGGTSAPSWTTVPQGLKNYITLNNNLEQGNTTGYSLGNVALTNAFPSGVPTFGSGASGNLSIAASSTSPLSGINSLLYVSSAATTAGNLLATDAFSLDREAQGTVLAFSFAYEAAVNPANINMSGTSLNSYGVAIYDVTNSNWIQPAGVYNLVQSSGVGKATGTFQVPIDCASMRLVVFNANATSGAATLKLDSFFLGPQVSMQGPSGPVGEIFATGSKTSPEGCLYCDGRAISRTQYYDLFKVIGTSYGNGDGSTTFNIPDMRGYFLRGFSDGTTRDPDRASRTSQNGGASGDNVGSVQGDLVKGHTHDARYGVDGIQVLPDQQAIMGVVTYSGVTSGSGIQSTGSGLGSESRPKNINVAYHIRYRSNTVMSSDTDTRVVAFVGSSSTATTISASTDTLIPFTKERDTHGAWNGTTYKVTVPGFYSIAAYLSSASSLTLPVNNQFSVNLSKGGIFYREIGRQVGSGGTTTKASAGGETVVYCAAGEELSITCFCSISTSLSSSSAVNYLSIHRLSGPATVQASESVNCSYETSSGQLIPNNAVTAVNFESKKYDSHGTYNTSTGVFTAPIPGKYRVSASLGFSSSASGIRQVIIAKNGVYQTKSTLGTAGVDVGCCADTTTLDLKTGDTISILAYQTSGGTLALYAEKFYSHVEIERVGN